jgi:hypothetical protein
VWGFGYVYVPEGTPGEDMSAGHDAGDAT